MPRGRRTLTDEQINGMMNSVFSGVGFSDIAESVGVSVQTVRNRLSRFIAESGKEGLIPVARRYGVEGKVRSLVDLSQELGSDLSVSESIIGARMIKNLRSLNVDASRLEAFIDGIYAESQTQSLKPRDFVRACADLGNFKKKTGKDYLDILAEYEFLVESNEKLRVKNVELAEEKRSTVKTIQDSIREKKTTRETLNWFSSTRDKLEESDIPVEELDSLLALVLNMKGMGYDLEPVLDFYSSSTNLEEKKINLEKNVHELQEEQSALLYQNNDLKQKIADNQQLVTAVNELEYMNLDRGRVRSLTDTVTTISARHGMVHAEALDKFFSDIEGQYDEKLGYENELSRLKSTHARLEKDIEEREDDIARLEKAISPKKDVIQSLSHLNEHDVTNEDIIYWSEIFDENSMDLITVRREMAQLGGLRQWFDEKNEDRRKLEGEIEALTREIDTLKIQKENYEAELESLTTGALAEAKLELKRLPGIIDELRKDLLDPKTGLKGETLTMIDDTHDKIETELKKKEESWTKLFEKAEEKVEEINSQVNDILEATYKAGEMVGQYKALEPVRMLEAGEDLPRHTGLLAIYGMNAHFRNFFERHMITNCLRETDRLLDELDKELRNLG